MSCDDQPEQQIDACDEKATVCDKQKNMAQVVATEPPLVNEEQRWALIAAVGPDGLGQRNKQFAFNVLGAFRTADDAHAFAKRLNGAGYDLFDLYVVSTRKFIPLPPPNPTELEDVRYHDRLLDKIMSSQRQKAVVDEGKLQKHVSEYCQVAGAHNEKAREERKRVRCVIGQPQSEPPSGVDMSRVQKLKL